jgi:uncharacterized protein
VFKAELTALIPTLCTRCGRCCLKPDYIATLTASPGDVRRWRREGRHDILAYAEVIGSGADLWIRPDGSECTRCPFLRKDRNAVTYRCRIHATKPQPCRDYPASYDQMVEDGCEIVHELVARGIDATGWSRS